MLHINKIQIHKKTVKLILVPIFRQAKCQVNEEKNINVGSLSYHIKCAKHSINTYTVYI